MNLRLGFALKLSLIFGKISASCSYKLCPCSIKRSVIPSVYLFTFPSTLADLLEDLEPILRIWGANFPPPPPPPAASAVSPPPIVIVLPPSWLPRLICDETPVPPRLKKCRWWSINDHWWVTYLLFDTINAFKRDQGYQLQQNPATTDVKGLWNRTVHSEQTRLKLEDKFVLS